MTSRSLLGSALAVFSVLGATFASGCGAGGAGEMVRPKDPTAAQGIGEAPCREAESSGEPLVVDWKPEQRGDLELLMKENVAIVSYSCKGFKLLKECKVDGKYGFIGMSKKEQVVQLTNADEVKANLPLAGAGISGEVARGSTLDVAMVMVGKVKTTWGKVQAGELQGDCEGATHFVKGAMVGAFVMQTGTKGQVKTAAQMFGAGGSGSSTSEKNIKNKDGDIGDCAKASPDDKKAPSQCQAFIRLELKAIAPKKGDEPPPPEAKASAGDVAAVEPTCPKGLVLADGKCTEPKSVPAYLCNATSAAECVEQCGKGNGGSCGAAGGLYTSGRGGAARDEAKARELYGKGCDANDMKSCTNLGVLLTQGRGGAKDPAAAAKNFEKSCGDADALACAMLGGLYQTGEGVTKDEARAVGLLQKGCEGGDDYACGAAGKMLLDGKGAAKDPTKAIDFMKRACDGNQAQSCADLGQLYEVGGQGTPKNAIMAKLLYQRGCFRGNAQGCVDQGRLELGQGGSPDAAKRAFEWACNRQNVLGCAAMKVLFGGTRPVMGVIDAQNLSKGCNSGSMRDCAAAGTLHIASGNKGIGMPMVDRACLAQDPLACAVKKKN